MYEEDSEGPKATFEIYKAEADSLYKQGGYKKAIESYTMALDLQENDKNCLVSRSKCYLKLGDTENALQDAEAALTEDKTFHKGIYQKAQALYYMGDFEMALVNYHRGQKLRPELPEFRLGIQKAQEAIDNSVGSPDKVKLTTEGDLSFFKLQDEKKMRKKTQGKSHAQALLSTRKGPSQSSTNEKTVKHLLGELYDDRQYLEKLLKETNSNTEMDKTISNLVNEGLNYLDTRSDFWRQQKPMYTRRHDKIIRRETASTRIVPNEYIIQELEKIDTAQVEGRYKDALRRSHKCFSTVQTFTEEQVSNKMEVLANLYSCIGNAYLEHGDYEKAYNSFKADLDMGTKYDIEEAVSRGLDNLGRVHARSGEFDKAIEVWERKLPLSKSALENTWLNHEIGRCYLELNKYSVAKDYGETSLKAAVEAKDIMWQLQATVLIAQAEVKQGDAPSAQATFRKALDLSIKHGDRSAETAIRKALDEISSKLNAGNTVSNSIEDKGQVNKDEEKADLKNPRGMDTKKKLEEKNNVIAS
ncbi:hypothetical protein CHS0354_020803 [Potamilus streckersoni]|uniref:Outer dynein arm-docking complex subunit 4 n=1 Tax=Potamilus streckersoni TaxID=2493646 RepID=A0AAE0VHD5_9BIVA|nr:hypothetical protein CHS0354_020803 [Potamilus streckersoni]